MNILRTIAVLFSSALALLTAPICAASSITITEGASGLTIGTICNGQAVSITGAESAHGLCVHPSNTYTPGDGVVYMVEPGTLEISDILTYYFFHLGGDFSPDIFEFNFTSGNGTDLGLAPAGLVLEEDGTLQRLSGHTQCDDALRGTQVGYDIVPVTTQCGIFPDGLEVYVQSDTSTSAVPEPASILLLSTGLLGLGWLRRRKA